MTQKSSNAPDTKHVEVAKAELKNLEKQANLPPSGSAGFIQFMGILCVLGSFFSLTESFPAALVGAILGGFIIASGRLQQVIFDVRTLMLRDAFRRGEIGVTSAENTDA